MLLIIMVQQLQEILSNPFSTQAGVSFTQTGLIVTPLKTYRWLLITFRINTNFLNTIVRSCLVVWFLPMSPVSSLIFLPLAPTWLAFFQSCYGLAPAATGLLHVLLLLPGSSSPSHHPVSSSLSSVLESLL